MVPEPVPGNVGERSTGVPKLPDASDSWAVNTLPALNDLPDTVKVTLVVLPWQTGLTVKDVVVIVCPRDGEAIKDRKHIARNNLQTSFLVFVFRKIRTMQLMILPDSLIKFRFQFSEKNPCHALPFLIKA